jgi:hypothetical protein
MARQMNDNNLHRNQQDQQNYHDKQHTRGTAKGHSAIFAQRDPLLIGWSELG